MFRFFKKLFLVGLTILSDFANVNSLSCISMFFPFSIETSKCSGSCSNINYPYAKICVPGIVKNLNVKVFNIMSRTNETRFIVRIKMFRFVKQLFFVGLTILTLL